MEDVDEGGEQVGGCTCVIVRETRIILRGKGKKCLGKTYFRAHGIPGNGQIAC